MGNKTRWKDGDEAIISFKQFTNVPCQWTGEYDRFTYQAERLPNLSGDPLYNETLVMYWITIYSTDNKMEVWTDNRKGATWTGNQQIGIARNELVESEIAKKVRENAEFIGEYPGKKSDIGKLSERQIQNKSDSEIWDEVFGKGVPDIFRWRPGVEIIMPEFIEVKGHDKMLQSQKEWFEVFENIFPGYRATIREP